MSVFIFVTMAITIIAMAVANASAQSKLKTRMEEKKDKYKSLKTDANGKYPLVIRNSFLNYNEMPFFEALQTNTAGMVICPKVNLHNVLSLAQGGNWKEADMEKLTDKRVDFLLCDSSSMKPVMAIELGLAAVNDDDAFIEKACKDAGLKFARCPSKERYSNEEVGAILDSHLGRNEKLQTDPFSRP